MALTGILLRRGLKASLVADPPILGEGELVYATDTGEHGWYDQPNDVLKWALLGEGGGSSWVNTSFSATPIGLAPTEGRILSFAHQGEVTISYSIASHMFSAIDVMAYNIVQLAGSLVVPSDMIDGDFLYNGAVAGERLVFASGTTEEGNNNSSIQGYSQKVNIRKTGGSIEVWITSNSDTYKIIHSCNTLILGSTTGITKAQLVEFNGG